jgi:hypothetical protein
VKREGEFRLAVLAVLALSVLTALAACTSTTSGGSSPTSEPLTTAGAPSTAPSDPPTMAPTTAVLPPSTAAPSTSTPAPATTTATAPAGPAACTPAQLTIRVLQGGAAQGQEIAAIDVTNSSSVTCSVTGYPDVSLLQGGAALGKPAQHSTVTAKPMNLAPGDQAQAILHDFSSCEAGLSDTARITLPGNSEHVDKKLQLRGCTLEIDPFAPPA